MRRHPMVLEYIPDKYKTEEMCKKAVDKEPEVLQYVPDYFVSQKMLVNPVCPIQEFCEDYRKRKNLKKAIYLELLPIAWYPSRFLDWCIPEDEKREIEKRWCK